MKLNSMQFSQLVDMYSPAAVFEEVKNIFVSSYPVNEFESVRKAYRDFINLYDGKYPGYCACNTHYHDKMHITDSLLALARLIDGYNAVHKKMPARLARLGFMAAIFHDAGYIQRLRDIKGTGAKYTLTHVGRSVNFVKTYFRKNKLGKNDARIVTGMIRCTDMLIPVRELTFANPAERTAALMLASADLLGQMAARCYLERLLFLYREFKEGRVKGYSSELGLLRKTRDFSKFVRKRLKIDLENTARYAQSHFKKKYRINRDFYREAMNKQLAYLTNTVLNHPKKYRKYLRRANPPLSSLKTHNSRLLI